MGNCCSGQQPSSSSSSLKWGGDDWGSVTSKCRGKTILFEEGGGEGNALSSKRQKLLGSTSTSSGRSSSTNSSICVNAGVRVSNNAHDHHGEIKIKISKKQLEKLLLEAADDHRQQQGSSSSSVNQVLSRLIMKGDMDGYHGHHQYSWRPVLQSIPEIN